MAVARVMDGIEQFFDLLDIDRTGFIHKSQLALVGSAVAHNWDQDQNQALMQCVTNDPQGRIRLPEVSCLCCATVHSLCLTVRTFPLHSAL